MRRFCGILASLGLMAFAPPAIAADGNCDGFTHGLERKAEGIFHSKSMSFEQKQQALVALFHESVDMEFVARYVSDGYWNDASPQDRAAFLSAYSAYLPDFYVGAFSREDMDDIDDIKIGAIETLSPGSYLAHALVMQKTDAPAEFDAQINRDATGHCRIREFAAEGVSMLESQREEIHNAGLGGGLPAITKKLKAKQH